MQSRLDGKSPIFKCIELFYLNVNSGEDVFGSLLLSSEAAAAVMEPWFVMMMEAANFMASSFPEDDQDVLMMFSIMLQVDAIILHLLQLNASCDLKTGIAEKLLFGLWSINGHMF